MNTGPLPRRILGLVLGLGLMVAAAFALHHLGDGGDGVLARSRLQGLEAGAYFYSEVGDVSTFLAEEGRYKTPRPSRGPAGP